MSYAPAPLCEKHNRMNVDECPDCVREERDRLREEVASLRKLWVEDGFIFRPVIVTENQPEEYARRPAAAQKTLEQALAENGWGQMPYREDMERRPK